MAAALRQLVNLLNKSVTTLEKVCEEMGTTIPDLQSLYTTESEAFRDDPRGAEAANIIGAAALHIAAILNPPQGSLYHFVGGVSAYRASCID